MTKGNLLVTGATGFVGSRLCKFAEKRFSVRSALRSAGKKTDVAVGDITPQTDWAPALEGTGVVVHLAARVHVMDDSAKNPLAEFCRVNVEGTVNLARQAAAAGVGRFVFVSSIKVNGEATLPARPFTPQDPACPQDPYAVSKQRAEVELHRLAAETGLEVVVIRPPLVYGPGVKGNFLRLMKAVHKGLPLPFGLVHNKRSLVALDNLVDLILTCIEHPDAAGQTFMVSDGKDLSTPDLIRKLAYAMGRPARLLPVPQGLLRLGGFMMGKEKEVDRLIGSLQVDISHTCDTLAWRPPVTGDDALWKTGRDFVSRLSDD